MESMQDDILRKRAAQYLEDTEIPMQSTAFTLRELKRDAAGQPDILKQMEDDYFIAALLDKIRINMEASLVLLWKAHPESIEWFEANKQALKDAYAALSIPAEWSWAIQLDQIAYERTRAMVERGEVLYLHQDPEAGPPA